MNSIMRVCIIYNIHLNNNNLFTYENREILGDCAFIDKIIKTIL